MKCYLKTENRVELSRCDCLGRLSIPDTFGACQDIAALHAEMIGIGGKKMADLGLFWLTTRTRIRFHKRPGMLSNYTLETWPRTPGAARCDRFYRASSGDRLLFEGRTEWCVWDTRALRARDPRDLFGPEFEFSDEAVLAAPYARFRHDFTDADHVLTYTVLPADIDMGIHMNNVAYPRLLANTFSAVELAKMPIREMEVLFMIPCPEGERLDVFRRETEIGWEFGVRRADGRYAALASITLDK